MNWRYLQPWHRGRPRRIQPARSTECGSLNLHPKLLGETNISLNDVVHISHAVSEHQGAFQAHAERDACISGFITPVGAHTTGMYHSSAALRYLDGASSVTAFY